MFAADSSSTETQCTNVPDLSSGSATTVQYGASTSTVSACDHSSLGFNYETTSTVAHSAVSGSTTEAEVRVTNTARTFSDVNPETATCNGAIFNWASYLLAQNVGLNQMTSICCASRDSDTLKFSCRE